MRSRSGRGSRRRRGRARSRSSGVRRPFSSRRGTSIPSPRGLPQHGRDLRAHARRQEGLRAAAAARLAGRAQTIAALAAALKAARVELNEMLKSSLVRPKQLLALFEEFDELVKIE